MFTCDPLFILRLYPNSAFHTVNAGKSQRVRMFRKTSCYLRAVISTAFEVACKQLELPAYVCEHVLHAKRTLPALGRRVIFSPRKGTIPLILFVVTNKSIQFNLCRDAILDTSWTVNSRLSFCSPAKEGGRCGERGWFNRRRIFPHCPKLIYWDD